MRVLRYTPKQPLGEFVDCLWYFEGSRSTRELALPTGTAELVITLRDEPIRVCSDVADLSGEYFGGAVVSGAQSRYMVLPPAQDVSVVGVHFRPGGATPLLGVPLGQLSDCHVKLEDLWESQANALRDRLIAAGSPAEALEIMERALIARLNRSSAHHPAVAHALRRFTAAPTVARVRDVADATGYSARRFIRLFTDTVGLSPKRFCRILRLQAAVTRLAAGTRVEWAEFAADSGYYDQSHLIREFRAMTGLTPAQYRPVDPGSPNHVAIGA